MGKPADPRILLSDLAIGESPRWHGGHATLAWSVGGPEKLRAGGGF